VLTGSAFTFESPYAGASDLGNKVQDLFVTLEIGGRDTFAADGSVLPVGGRDYRIDGNKLTLEGNTTLTVPIPAGALLGPAFVTVSRPMQAPLDGRFETQVYTSNPVKVLTVARYAFFANGGDDTVSVINTIATDKQPVNGKEIQKLSPPRSRGYHWELAWQMIPCWRRAS